MNFADFNEAMNLLKKIAHLKNSLKKKLKLQELVANITHFRKNDSIYIQNKITHLKNISQEKISYFAN